MKDNLRKPKLIIGMSLLFWLISIFIFSGGSRAGLSKNSKFLQAREPVSKLDLILYEKQFLWMKVFVDPADPHQILLFQRFRKNYPLISKSRVLLEPSYNGVKDTIVAKCSIGNIDEFLKLGSDERKQLVEELLDAFATLLSGDVRKMGEYKDIKMPIPLKRRDIIVDVRVYPYLKTGILPEAFAFVLGGGIQGQAGYYDGEFVFSEKYYLKISKSKDGKLVSQETEKFIIEKDPNSD